MKMLPAGEAMTRSTSVPVSTLSSCAFFMRPDLRLVKHTWRFGAWEMYLMSIFPLRLFWGGRRLFFGVSDSAWSSSP